MRRPITLTARGTKVLVTAAAGALAFTLATGCENSAPPPNDQEQEQEDGNQQDGNQQDGDQQDQDQPGQQQPGGGQQDGDQQDGEQQENQGDD